MNPRADGYRIMDRLELSTLTEQFLQELRPQVKHSPYFSKSFLEIKKAIFLQKIVKFLNIFCPQVRDSAGGGIAAGLRKLYSCIVCGTVTVTDDGHGGYRGGDSGDGSGSSDGIGTRVAVVDMRCSPVLINRLISELFFLLVAPSSCFLPSVRILAAALVCHLAPEGRIPAIFQEAFLDGSSGGQGTCSKRTPIY